MRLSSFLKPFSFIPAIVLMYIIFTFSGQEGDESSSLSYKVSYKIIQTADFVMDADLEEWQIAEYAHRINGVTRKAAHMTEYFLLTVAVSFPLYVYGVRGVALMLLAGLFCVAFAGTDEFHQSFVPGRAASVKDVGIDSVGVLIGVLLIRFVGWVRRMTFRRAAPAPASGGDRASQLTNRELKKLRKQQAKLTRELKKQNAARPDASWREPPLADPSLKGPRAGTGRQEGGGYPYRPDGGWQDPYDSGEASYRPGGRQNPYYSSGRQDPYYNRRNSSGSPEEGWPDPDDAYESSDQLSEDMPIFGHFQKKKKRKH